MDGKLLGKVLKRIEEMAGIEAFLILTVAALHLTVVPRCIRTNELVPDAQLSGSFLEHGRQITPTIGETVGKFKPIVGLNALYLYPFAGVPRPQLAYEVRISCALVLLNYFRLLRRIRLDEIPSRQLERLECFSEQQYQRSLEQGFDQEAEVYPKCRHRLISQTALFLYEANHFYEQLEETAQRWKTLGYTKDRFSYVQIAKREDPFLALNCFPQSENHDDIKAEKERLIIL